MAPLSKGAAHKLPKAIYERGIPAEGVYEFAQPSGESAPCTANPSTADAVPLKVNCPVGAREATLGCPLRGRQEVRC